MRFHFLGAALVGLCLSAPALAQPKLLTLQPERLPGMCISIAAADGGSISLPCDGSARQKFAVPGPEGGPIKSDDKCLAPRGDGNYPALYAEACDGSPAQTWKISDAGELRSAAGRCVSVLGASSRTGELVYAADCPKDYDGQAWRVLAVDFANPVERSFESKVRPGKCIGYDTGLALYDCTDAYRQVVSFDLKALGQLRMMSSCFAGGYAFNGLGLGECWDIPAQRWTILDNGAIANRLYRCIEVVAENGRDVLQTKPCRNGTPEQQWVLREPKKP